MSESSMFGDYIVSGELEPGLATRRFRGVKLGRAYTIEVFADLSSDRRAALRQRVARVSSLVDDHVVRVVATGEQGGDFYVVSEHVDGLSLEAIGALEAPIEARFNAAQIALIFAEACEGLLAIEAHEGCGYWTVRGGNLIVTSLGDVKIDLDVTRPIEDDGRGSSRTGDLGPLMAAMLTGWSDHRDEIIATLAAAPDGSLHRVVSKLMDSTTPGASVAEFQSRLRAWLQSQHISRWSAGLEDTMATLLTLHPAAPVGDRPVRSSMVTMELSALPPAKPTAHIVSMGATDHNVEAVGAESDRPASGADRRPGDLLTSMRGFGVGSGHIARVANVMTDSTVAAIARSTVSGDSEISRSSPAADEGPDAASEGEASAAPERTEGASPLRSALWTVLAILVFCLLAVTTLLAWLSSQPTPIHATPDAADVRELQP